MDRNLQISNKQHEQQQSKIYELLADTVTPGQGLEMMMRNLESEANALSSSDNNNQHTQQNNTSEESMMNGSATTMDVHPSIVLQNLGISGDDMTEDRPHMCQICHATYKTRTHLRRHMFVHLSNRPYPCPDCGKGFNRKEHLNKHIEAKHMGRKYKCQFCEKEISRKDHLSRHIKNMHSAISGATVKTEPCSSSDDHSILKVQLPCGQKQKAQLSFLSPIFSSGNNEAMIGDTIITPIHNSYTPKPARFKQAAQQHTPSGQAMLLPGNMMVTPTTITSSTPKSSLSRTSSGLMGSLSHQNMFNPSRNSAVTAGEKKMLLQLYTCTECTATFTNDKDLAIHSRIHKPQPYKCAECPRAYTRREKLTEHIRCFHQGQKFTCEYCGKELSRKDHVLRHVRSVHPEVLANRFASISDGEIADGSMRNNSTPLQGHNSSNIPSIGEMGVLLRSVCHICLKVFGTSYHLSRHIESCHNGDIRPYACSACSKQFKRKDHLTKHMKSHCPSMRESSKVPGAKTSLNIQGQNNANINTQNSGGLSNLEVDLAGIHPEAIESLQIEMMSPEDEEEENGGNNSSQMETNTVGDAGDENNGEKGGNSDGISENVNRKLIESSADRKSGDVDNDFSLAAFLTGETEIQSNNRNDLKTDSTQLIQTPTLNTVGVSNVQRSQRYPCGHCQKEFTARNKLLEHLQEHSNHELIRPLNNQQNVTVITETQQIQQNLHSNIMNTSNNGLWGQ